MAFLIIICPGGDNVLHNGFKKKANLVILVSILTILSSVWSIAASKESKETNKEN